MTQQTRQATPSTDEPIVCTMPTGEADEQLVEWADLQHRATNVSAVDRGVRMTLPASMASQVRDLVRREASCCAFLTLDITVEDDDLILEVTAANPDALPVISMLAGIALP
jgi:hypothetical protein